MDNEQITPRINTTKYNVKISVMHVFRANFNDTYWLDERIITPEEINTGELYWFDPYLGRSKTNDTMVAIAECTDERLVVLTKQSEKIKKTDYEPHVKHIICEDFDSSVFLAAHIRLWSK